jgi:hypothetical protein
LEIKYSIDGDFMIEKVLKYSLAETEQEEGFLLHSLVFLARHRNGKQYVVKTYSLQEEI